MLSTGKILFKRFSKRAGLVYGVVNFSLHYVQSMWYQAGSLTFGRAIISLVSMLGLTA